MSVGDNSTLKNVIGLLDVNVVVVSELNIALEFPGLNVPTLVKRDPAGPTIVTVELLTLNVPAAILIKVDELA